MKKTFAVIALASLFFALPTTASYADIESAPVAHATVSDTATASQDLPFTLTVEHLAGIAAWLPVGTFQLSANSSEDSVVTINYKNESYVANFKIRAAFLGMHLGHESWQLTVTRFDTLNGQAYSAPVTSELTVDRGGAGIRLVTKGRYGVQARDLRLGFTLNN